MARGRGKHPAHHARHGHGLRRRQRVLARAERVVQHGAQAEVARRIKGLAADARRQAAEQRPQRLGVARGKVAHGLHQGRGALLLLDDDELGGGGDGSRDAAREGGAGEAVGARELGGG